MTTWVPSSRSVPSLALVVAAVTAAVGLIPTAAAGAAVVAPPTACRPTARWT